MDLPYPDKYHQVVKYFDYYIGDLEQTLLLTDAQRLLFYALRQQAEYGPCTSPQPSLWYMKERHKHQAWKQLGRMSTFEAMVFFVQQFEQTLWLLEHPDDSESDAAMKARIDWPARLQELEVDTPTTKDAAAAGSGARGEENKNGQVHHGTNDKHSTSETSQSLSCSLTSSPPADVAKQATAASTSRAASSLPPSTAFIPAEEMIGWDSDIVDHAALSVDNLRYLATELMRARQALRQPPAAPAPGSVAVAQRCLHGVSAKDIFVPLPPCAVDMKDAAAAPPLKPMWTTDGKTVRVPVIPLPVRFSAASLTEAAMRPPGNTFTVKGATPQQSPASVHPDASISWFA